MCVIGKEIWVIGNVSERKWSVGDSNIKGENRKKERKRKRERVRKTRSKKRERWRKIWEEEKDWELQKKWKSGEKKNKKYKTKWYWKIRKKNVKSRRKCRSRYEIALQSSHIYPSSLISSSLNLSLSLSISLTVFLSLSLSVSLTHASYISPTFLSVISLLRNAEEPYKLNIISTYCFYLFSNIVYYDSSSCSSVIHRG